MIIMKISLDVIFFTNISIDIALECVNDNWNFISEKCNLPKTEFLIAVRLILDSTYFVFDNIIYINRIYKQNFGTLMGSLLLLIIADLVMQN